MLSMTSISQNQDYAIQILATPGMILLSYKMCTLSRKMHEYAPQFIDDFISIACYGSP